MKKAFGGKKAAPFAKGGGRKKTNKLARKGPVKQKKAKVPPLGKGKKR